MEGKRRRAGKRRHTGEEGVRGRKSVSGERKERRAGGGEREEGKC